MKPILCASCPFMRPSIALPQQALNKGAIWRLLPLPQYFPEAVR